MVGRDGLVELGEVGQFLNEVVLVDEVSVLAFNTSGPVGIEDAVVLLEKRLVAELLVVGKRPVGTGGTGVFGVVGFAVENLGLDFQTLPEILSEIVVLFTHLALVEGGVDFAVLDLIDPDGIGDALVVELQIVALFADAAGVDVVGVETELEILLDAGIVDIYVELRPVTNEAVVFAVAFETAEGAEGLQSGNQNKMRNQLF